MSASIYKKREMCQMVSEVCASHWDGRVCVHVCESTHVHSHVCACVFVHVSGGVARGETHGCGRKS